MALVDSPGNFTGQTMSQTLAARFKCQNMKMLIENKLLLIKARVRLKGQEPSKQVLKL